MQVIYLMSLSPNARFCCLLLLLGPYSAYSPSQSPSLAGFLLGSSYGRHSKKVGRQGKGRQDWVPISSFPASTTPEWQQQQFQSPLSFCTLKPSLCRLLQDTSSSWWQPSKFGVPQNPHSELLGPNFSASFLLFL